MAGINIVPFVTKLDIAPERVINALRDAGLTDVTVIGVDGDGELYFASSLGDGMAVMWRLQLAIKQILDNNS
jgi:basic membrane lipoprotein Med (substrate-binding protein (PBP1-ABC) superfamily)